MHKAFSKIRSMMQSTPRYQTVLPNPLNDGSPWFFTAGPVFTPGADGAILNSKLSKPWQTWNGYSYRVEDSDFLPPLQRTPQLYAPKGVPTVGINIQNGFMQIESPSVNSDGTFANMNAFGDGMSQAFQYGTSYMENSEISSGSESE
jgi:hypothetical protein